MAAPGKLCVFGYRPEVCKKSKFQQCFKASVEAVCFLFNRHTNPLTQGLEQK